MRLLNTRTISLEEFFGTIPDYAILSHTWGKDEVTFQDMQIEVEKAKTKKGYQKILQTCRVALRNGLEYAWVDTCCIDKTSSAELSEAINSMFSWYQNAKICYAFLEDVPPEDTVQDVHKTFIKSRWFTRGWTLQELLAPRAIVFYASDWSIIDTRSAMATQIAEASEIDPDVLKGVENPSVDLQRLLRRISIAERMSWVSLRQTTRVEDIAYCLLGIFGVNMPLLYGEGNRAFRRLQEEIIKSSNDESIFAWGTEYHCDMAKYMRLVDMPDPLTSTIDPEAVRASENAAYGVFAETPYEFRGCGDIMQCKAEDAPAAPFSTTNLGVHIELLTGWIWAETPVKIDGEDGGYYAVLQCRRKQVHDCLLAIPIQHPPLHTHNVWHRRAGYLRPVHSDETSLLTPRSVYLATDLEAQYLRGLKFWIRSAPSDFSLQDIEVSNSCTWDHKARSLTVDSWDAREAFLGKTNVPFILSFGEEGPKHRMGVQLSVKAPSNLFPWPMPWWADYEVTLSIPERGETWLENPPMQTNGSRYLVTPDSRVVYVQITSQTVQGARFFVVDICAVPTGLGDFPRTFILPFILSDRMERLTISIREKAEACFYFISSRMREIPIHTSPGKLWNWPVLAGCLTFAYAVYYSKLSLSSRPAANIYTFHAIDFTWNAIAAFWGTRDSRLGKKVNRVPIVVQCGIYVVLIKLSFAQGTLAWAIINLSNFFIAIEVFKKKDGLYYVAGLYFLSLLIFPLMQNVFDCGGVQC